MIKKFFTEFIDFFLPRVCFGCGNNLPINEEIICSTCKENIKKPDVQFLQEEFNRKYYNRKIISGIDALYVFEREKEFQNIIHHLKYRSRFKIGIYLGEQIAEAKIDFIINNKIDLIIPVPLHRIKKAERGFNQSDYIVKGLSSKIKIPAEYKAVSRIKNTASQTKMNLSERQINIKNAFKIKNENAVKGKTIILVDDLMTTGSTLSECAKILLDAGAKKIFAISAAIADRENQNNP
ncbi:MAG: ComF family protein [Syntrophothermus sp.]